ncbi:BACON domain-containing carbohydrate-binding protein [Butyricimonas sp.]|uniref:BACON domain-containing protein n=1 Tax=Butyricimonas sp. TaxID=1969738 RepID=UPI0025C1880B|nr:BACON domain-containing carbohydrate-binding protein [Butyricimonas sp.]
MNKKLSRNVWWMLLTLLVGCSDDKKGEMVLPESNLTINPETELVFQQAGASMPLSISTNRNWTVMKGEGSWYRVEGDESGEPGEFSVNVVATENGGIEKRESKIAIQAGTEKKELNVIQFGSEPDLVLTEKEINVEYQGGIREFIVNSNTDVELSAVDDWLRLPEKTYIMDNTVSNIFTVYCMPNDNEKRTGKLIVKAGSKEDYISFVQEGWKAEVILEREEVVVGGMKKLCEVMLTASGDWTIEYEGGNRPGWITDAPQGGKKGAFVLSFELDQNLEAIQRTCQVLIRCGSLTKPLTIVQLPVLKRERDSLALQAIYRAANSHGNDTWNFDSAISKWNGVKLEDDRVVGLHLHEWTFYKIPVELGELDGLTEMTFSYCLFNDPKLPDEVGNWSKLDNFSCIGTQSVIFPETVKGWSHLGTLYMSGDYFRGMTLEGAVLPDILCGISTLHTVSFYHSDLKELPEALAQSNVEILVVETGQLTQIPDFLGKMTKLFSLLIRNCPVGTPVPVKVFDAPVLRSCNLSHDGLTGTIPEEVYSSSSLYELNLAANNLTGDLSEALVDSGIQMFDVVQNRLGGIGKKLSERIKLDPRFIDTRAWNGNAQICRQQENYGWSNCEN